MMESVHLQLPAELLARVDEARGDVPRNAWLRRAIERALADPSPQQLDRKARTVARESVAAAQRAEDAVRRVGIDPGNLSVPEPPPLRARSSSQSKRDVRPIPKGER